MHEEQRITQRCVNKLEAALLEYIEKYGPTKKANLAISNLMIERTASKNNPISHRP